MISDCEKFRHPDFGWKQMMAYEIYMMDLFLVWIQVRHNFNWDIGRVATI